MRILCSWTILVLSIVGMPVWAGSDSNDLWTSFGNIESALEIQASQIPSSFTELRKDGGERSANTHQSNKLSINESGTQLTASTDSKEFSSDSLPLTPTRASAILFRDNLQAKPIYWLKAEFNPRTTTTGTSISYLLKDATVRKV